jgi:hypothetical protein
LKDQKFFLTKDGDDIWAMKELKKIETASISTSVSPMIGRGLGGLSIPLYGGRVELE